MASRGAGRDRDDGKWERDDRHRNDRRKEIKQEVPSDEAGFSRKRADREKERSRDRSPVRRHHQEGTGKERSRSPGPSRERNWRRSPRRGEGGSPRRHHDEQPRSAPAREWGSFEPSGKLKEEKWGPPSLDTGSDQQNEKKKEVEKPSFEPSGKLTEETNTYQGVVIKYNEPPEAQLPRVRWRIYPFKGEEQLPEIFVHRQSAYLIGRERKIADVPIDHPSCSKQHAALQYRSMPYEREDGSQGRRVRPYIIDLGSANGTYLNGDRIEAQRYVELREKDVLKFGFSTREYVLLSENATERDGADSDVSDQGGPGIDITGADERRLKEEDDSMF